MRKSTLQFGDRVRVLRNNKYVDIEVGDTGTVNSQYGESVRVVIDGKYNRLSSKGYFYLTRAQLELIEYNKETTIMTGNFRIANVAFIEGTNTNKTYRYACYDPSIMAGDICVVKSAHHGFGIAKVLDIWEKDTSEEVTREIVCKCDFSEYNKRVETRKRMAELKDLMNERAKQLQDVALFRMLAQGDADMANMVAEYEALTGGLTSGR